MEKVKLPKEIADCIELARKAYATNHDILKHIELAAGTCYLVELKQYFYHSGESTVDDLLEVLVNDYEIEESPEEELFEKFNNYFQSTSIGCHDSRYYAGKVAGIREAIDVLDIKIEGINK